jgi:hypothetical protein
MTPNGNDPLVEEELLDAGDGDLRLRDLWEVEAVRPAAMVVLLMFVGVALGVHILVTEPLPLVDWCVTAVGTLLVGGVAMDHLDRLDCLLREEHTCRHCAEENSRWAAVEATDYTLSGRLARIVRKLKPRRG